MESNESREITTHYNSYSSESSGESQEQLSYNVVSSSSKALELEREINNLQEMLRLQRELDKLDNMRQKVLQKMQQNRR